MSKKNRKVCEKLKSSVFDRRAKHKYWERVIHEIESEVKKKEKLTENDLKRVVDGEMLISLRDILFRDGANVYTAKHIQCFKEETKPTRRKSSEIREWNEGNSLEVLHSNETDESLQILEESSYESSFEHENSSVYSENLSLGNDNNVDALLENEFKKRSSKRINKDKFDFEAYRSMENLVDPKPKDLYYMYKNFFKKSKEDAAIWRPRRVKAYEELTLAEKAQYITNKVSSEFVEWMKQVEPTDSMNINLENLLQMFAIGADSKASQLDLQMTEIPCIPSKYANYKRLPGMCKDRYLIREMLHDIKASQEEPKLLAFGSQISATNQVRPNLNDVAAQWHQARCGREDVITMEAVWKGITNLSTTKGFVEYLKTKPEIEPPKYLVTEGLFDKNLSSDNSSKTTKSDTKIGD